MADTDIERNPNNLDQTDEDSPQFFQHEKDIKVHCCDLLSFIWYLLTTVFELIKSVLMWFANLIGCIWYSIKERSMDCCECCGKRLN